jgi:hypothetical protein
MSLSEKQIYYTNSDDLVTLKKLLDLTPNGVKSFRYFKTRKFNVLKNHLCTFLYQKNGEYVGYGHLDFEDNNVWLGIFIIDEYVGQKIGDEIIKHLLKNYDGDILLIVDKTNIPALILYLKNGFTILDMNDIHYKMILKKK